MDSFLLNKIEEATPKINPIIADGIAVQHMAYTEQYVQDILTSVHKDFPKDLEYVGCERCSPAEEFRKVTEKKGSRASFDIARSDLYLMKYYFKYKGELLSPKYLFLPFVGAAGSLVLSGSRYFIAPVLSDVVISVGVNEVFVRLLRAKIRFHRIAQNIIVDGNETTVQVIWSAIHNKNTAMKKLKSPVNAFTTLPHYLFCKYGFYETFSRFGKCNVTVGTSNINKNDYPENEWVICGSTRKKPRGAARGLYEPSNIRLAIRKEEFTPFVKSLVAGFFYVADLFPDRITPEYVDVPRLWKILLGLILFSDVISEGKLHDDIDKHIDSLDSYMDVIIKNKLKDIKLECEDIYVLFSIIIENFNTWLLEATDDVNSMYGKELSVLYDVLYDISNSIFQMLFKLRAVTKKELTRDAIDRTMAKHFRMKTIYQIVKQRKGVSTLGYSGDNKFFKITSELVPQSSSGGRGSKKERIAVDDPYLQLHASIAEVGSFLFLPKPDPSGHAKVSPFVSIGPKGEILRDPKRIELIDSVQQSISRRAH